MVAGNLASAMSIRRRLLPRVLFILAALVAVCALPGCGDGGGKSQAYKTVAEYFPVKLGDRTVRLQLAVHPIEMQNGLMGRTQLGADDGMLFAYPQPQALSFWMRNTLIPLDIGYFDGKGVLKEIHQLYPNDERAVRSVGRDLQYAVEMNQGWYRDRGVKPGAKLDLEALKKALEARGFEPRAFGIE